jgi:1-acyl-sn-glycerol-3-phosphate acyltransferase
MGGLPVQPRTQPIPLVYRLIRAFFRFLTGVWFREIHLVDDEYLESEGGVLFVSWHPNGLIDPMLMTARLPGKLTTLVKHQVFRIPLLGWVFRMAGVVPIGHASKRAIRLGLARSDAAILSTMAEELAHGGQVLVFPEETTHGEAMVQKIRSGPARMLLGALRVADANGWARPCVVPVGLHYSASSRFRERAALVLERPMTLPVLPEAGANLSEPSEDELAWIAEVTTAIEGELKRANLAKASWHERTLIWKGRSLVQAEKQRQAGQALSRATYAESLLGARRLRAGWEFMLNEEKHVADDLANACERHFERLDSLNLRPHDVDARPPKLTAMGFVRVFCSWCWAVVWMFGLVTWGAMIGNYLPYKFQGLLERFTRRLNTNESFQGSIKVLSSVVVFPLWWVFLSSLLVWFLLDTTSPVYLALVSHRLLTYVTELPAAGVFVFFMLFWPSTARAHLNLYARLVRSTRRFVQWRAWSDTTKDWDELITNQQRLAARLVQLGAELVLPGDDDWIDPPSGSDDVVMVRRREPIPSSMG